MPEDSVEAEAWGGKEEYERTAAIIDQLQQIAEETLIYLGEDINRGCGDTCGEADFEFT